MKVKTKLITDLYNPSTNNVWGVGIIGEDLVRACLISKSFLDQPVELSAERYFFKDEAKLLHAMRIAYLVEHGWDDEIQIDVGIPAMCCHVDWPITDGNHRLYAAIIRGDEYINVGLSGDCDYIEELFDVVC